MDATSDATAPTEVKQTVCPLDCADTCSIEVTVASDSIQSVRGSNRNPFTRSKLCAKVVNSFPAQVHGDQRIQTPLIRRDSVAGNHFEPIGWSEAISLIHEQFSNIIDRWGSEAIAPLFYGGPMGLLAGKSMDRRFFHRLGATQVDASTLCAGTSSAAWEAVFGDAGGIDFEELSHSRLIIVWGNNVTACNLHATKIIRDARKTGSKLVVIDPKRTRIARDADLHIPLIPGSDVALVYGVVNLLAASGDLDNAFIAAQTSGIEAFLDEAAAFPLERAASLCGVETSAIEDFARLLATTRPAGMSIGVAPERNRNGSAGVRAALSLMAVTGNIGPLGAGICDTSRYFPIGGDQLTRPDLAPRPVRRINVMDIPKLVTDPGNQLPIKGLFIYNHNPVAVHPQAGAMQAALLSDEVFVVGSDVSFTDSMRCCDLVLPAPTHFEYGDVYKAYGHRYLQRSQPVIPLQGEAITNMELFRRLAATFGFTESCFRDSDETLSQQALETLTDPSIHTRSLEGAVDMAAHAEPAMLRGATFDTASGRIELFSAAMEAHCGQGVPKYQPLDKQGEFIVVSPASEKRVNSTFGGIKGQADDLLCEIHPEDAARCGVVDGAQVLLSNDAGKLALTAKITDAVRPGTLFVPKGAWITDSPTGNTINALIPGHQEAAIGGACYYDCTVDLRPH